MEVSYQFSLCLIEFFFIGLVDIHDLILIEIRDYNII
jgi:hypothetical protein